MYHYFLAFTFSDKNGRGTGNATLTLSHEISAHSITKFEDDTKEGNNFTSIAVTFFGRLAD